MTDTPPNPTGWSDPPRSTSTPMSAIPGFGSTSTDNPAGRKKGGCLKKIVIALVILVAIIGALVFVVFKTTAGAEKQARAFAEELIANDVDAAYARTSTDFREATSKASLAEIATGLNGLLGGGRLSNTSRAISSTSSSGSVATIDYTATKGEAKVYIRVMLRKDDGWKVVNFRSSENPIPDEEPTTDTTTDATSPETTLAA